VIQVPKGSTCAGVSVDPAVAASDADLCPLATPSSTLPSCGRCRYRSGSSRPDHPFARRRSRDKRGTSRAILVVRTGGEP